MNGRITPLRCLTVNDIIVRADDLVMSSDDIRAMAINERHETIMEFLTLCEQENSVYGLDIVTVRQVAKKMFNSNKLIK